MKKAVTTRGSVKEKGKIYERDHIKAYLLIPISKYDIHKNKH